MAADAVGIRPVRLKPEPVNMPVQITKRSALRIAIIVRALIRCPHRHQGVDRTAGDREPVQRALPAAGTGEIARDHTSGDVAAAIPGHFTRSRFGSVKRVGISRINAVRVESRSFTDNAVRSAGQPVAEDRVRVLPDNDRTSTDKLFRNYLVSRIDVSTCLRAGLIVFDYGVASDAGAQVVLCFG